MAPAKLEKEDHERDAAFNKVLHGKSAAARGGLTAMWNKGAQAQEEAVDEYFKHWDKKAAADETDEIREVCIFFLKKKMKKMAQFRGTLTEF